MVRFVSSLLSLLHQYVYVYVYVSAHVYVFMTFHNGFMFLIHLLYINMFKNFLVIMNRHGRHNIGIGIVRVQTGHSTGTRTATWCVIEL